MSDYQDYKYDVIILGAGMGGLSAAWELVKLGKRVAIVETKPHVAGVITTQRVDDFLIEYGPNSFTSRPDDIMDLVEETGLSNRAIRKSMSKHDRFIWRGGQLRKAPGEALTPGEKAKAFAGLVKSVPPPKDDVSIGSFFRARVGDAVVDNMLKPFLAGVYAANADEVSFEATLPKIYHMVRNDSRLAVPVAKRALSLIMQKGAGGKKSERSLVSFPTGLRELPMALQKRLEEKGVRFFFNAEPELEEGSRECWRIIAKGKAFEAKTIICATEAWPAARLIESQAPIAASLLSRLKYAPLTIIHAGLREDQLTENRNGFGFLTVENQGVRMLGMIWSEKLFRNRAPRGYRLLTCFYGGSKDPEIEAWDDEQIREQFITDLKTTMGYTGGDFRLFKITRWNKALPTYPVGHVKTVKRIQAALPGGIELLGNYLGNISMPNRVVAAKELVEKIR